MASEKQLYHVELSDELVNNFDLKHGSGDIAAFSPRQAFRSFVFREGGDEEVYAQIKDVVMDDTEQYVMEAFRFLAHHYTQKALDDPDYMDRMMKLFSKNGIAPTNDPLVIEDTLEARYREKWGNKPRALRAVLGTVEKQRQATIS